MASIAALTVDALLGPLALAYWLAVGSGPFECWLRHVFASSVGTGVWAGVAWLWRRSP